MGKYVEVYIDEQDFLEALDDEDLIEEMKSRNLNLSVDIERIVTEIWLKRRVGFDYQKEIDNLIYEVIGKIV